METQEILKELIGTGPIGAVLAVMLWFNYKVVQKLFEVIEANTKVLSELTEKINELTQAQNARRAEFKQ